MSTDMSWRQDALCAQTDPELFFPDQGGDNGTLAKSVCALCDVTAQCLDYAITHDLRSGVWGGTTATERTRQRRHRPQQTPPRPRQVDLKPLTCGTLPAYRRHRRLREKPDQACLDACARYRKTLRTLAGA